MCGICGIVDFAGIVTTHEEREIYTRRMLDKMRHRGPDHHDIVVDGISAIGASRLSILDRTAAGHQPLRSLSGRHVMAFNGEIYDHRALRESLQAKGDKFFSTSDSEVLMRLFEKKGKDCLDELRGMFAFAVWDSSSRSLFLARDRVGEKPLVYSFHNGCFAFASETAALLELPWISREPDWIGIHYGIQYVHIPAPHTAFKAVSKLPPATMLEVNDKGMRSSRYWKLRFDQRYGPGDKQKCCRDVSELLDETTALMGTCDVPVGTFLSGGLDSSAVTASLATSLKGFPSFRISHPGPLDEIESMAASAVAARSGVRLHNLQLDHEILDSVGSLVRAYAEPSGTMVGLDYFRLAAEASKHVTVALSGNGADEMFGGYNLNVMEEMDRNRAHWSVMRHVIGDGCDRSSASPGIKAFVSRMQEFDQIGPQLFYANMYLNPGKVFSSNVYSPRMSELTAAHDPAKLLVDKYYEADTDLLFNSTAYQMLNLTCQYSLVDHSDACGMASSLEVRSPFLDVKMLELAASIPSSWKLGRRGDENFGKMILRESMLERLPADACFGLKLGFGGTVPHSEWLRADWDRLFDRDAIEATGMFDVQKIDLMVKNDLAEHKDLSHMLFNVLTIGTWYSMFCK